MRAIQLLATMLTIALALPPTVRAQDNPERQLTGDASREWVFKRVVRSMGPGDACTSGLTYTFEQAIRVTAWKFGRLVPSRERLPQ